jgi:cytochrome c biogenesis protein CcdA/thiol-disulfide isomerase/thioredoxin
MVYFLLSYLAGALTILAPCILPVVPFVFARVDKPFATSSLPLLAGMAMSFASVASLGAVAGAWAVEANAHGRLVALAVLALMGMTLLAPTLAERLARPLVACGSRLSNLARRREASTRSPSPLLTSFVLGLATGLLWAPCAGPVLGLVLTAAALQGPSVQSWSLLLAYAAGAVTSLALVLSLGQRVFAGLKRWLGVGEWLRRGLGVAVLATVVATAFGLDTGALSNLSNLSQGAMAWEQKLLDRLPPPRTERSADVSAAPADILPVQANAVPHLLLPSEGAMPPLTGAVEWLNSAPLTALELRGKVVLVYFWTFGCFNCKNALPHVREWHNRYKDQGLVVIGVHSPEFAFEKRIDNVKRAMLDLDVPFPVAVDNSLLIWRAFRNHYWPANYFVDARGQVRFHHFGEGEYDKSEQVIRQLLEESRKEKS